MFDLVETAAVARQAYYLGVSNVNTQFDYDYQPGIQDPLSTVESGLSKNEVVDVKAGDMVYDSSGDGGRAGEGRQGLRCGRERGRVRRHQPAQDEAAHVDLQVQGLHLERRHQGVCGGP